MATWLLVLAGVLADPGYMGGPLLHSHEMVFGFAVADVLGFLTTALPNFAGAMPLTGRPLAVLVAIWEPTSIRIAVIYFVGSPLFLEHWINIDPERLASLPSLPFWLSSSESRVDSANICGKLVTENK